MHEKLLDSNTKKKRNAEGDPDWCEEQLDKVQTQSLKKRLTILRNNRRTVIVSGKKKKKKCGGVVTQV